ncbi:MAG: hypothetical protein ACHRXM_00915 [Isosphaerales bacterium]
MRQAWFLVLWRRRLLGVILAGELAFTGLGCHPNYYCYDNPCAPASAMPRSVQSGPVCDVPTQVVEGGTTLADGASRSTTVTGGSTTSPRVVVSEPSTPSKFSWRRSDPDGSLPITSVQGTVDDPKVNR